MPFYRGLQTTACKAKIYFKRYCFKQILKCGKKVQFGSYLIIRAITSALLLLILTDFS